MLKNARTNISKHINIAVFDEDTFKRTLSDQVLLSLIIKEM